MRGWLSKLRRDLIMDGSGYSVQILGRVGLRYREGERAIFVDSEILAGENSIGAYSGSIKAWDPPNEKDPIDEEERSRIIDNIRRALESKGYELQVI
jgi:hypothetical protein